MQQFGIECSESTIMANANATNIFAWLKKCSLEQSCYGPWIKELNILSQIESN